jgi:DNA/RNA endonuclease YhcR with UshA esterase domain
MSSYNLPAAVGSASATGAEAVAIAAQPGGTNENGNATDSAGNIRVDFVWGSRPAQPNDNRADGTPTPTEVYGASQNGQWTTKSTVASARLNPALNNHSDIEAEWGGFPGFIAADGNYMITAASGDGTTVTYTSQNKLAAGDVVNITGLTASAYNLSSATVASANKLQFTVTNAANAGLITGQWYGKVEKTTARSAADGAGIPNIVVPNVLGLTTAVALDLLKDAGYEAASITTDTAATNAAGVVTAVARTAGSTTITISDNSHGFVAGNKVTISGVDSTVDGTYTVVSAPTVNTFTVTGTATTVLAPEAITGSVVAVAGTIKAQSVAAGTANVLSTATITITPWAVAS